MPSGGEVAGRRSEPSSRHSSRACLEHERGSRVRPRRHVPRRSGRSQRRRSSTQRPASSGASCSRRALRLLRSAVESSRATRRILASPRPGIRPLWRGSTCADPGTWKGQEILPRSARRSWNRGRHFRCRRRRIRDAHRSFRSDHGHYRTLGALVAARSAARIPRGQLTRKLVTGHVLRAEPHVPPPDPDGFPHAPDLRRAAADARPAAGDGERNPGHGALPAWHVARARRDGRLLREHAFPLGFDVSPLVPYDQRFLPYAELLFADCRPLASDEPPAG
jgi:hypothetical protein